MTLSPVEIERIADVIAERLAALLGNRSDTDEVMDKHGVADLMGCSVPTVERLTATGEIPSFKLGRLRKYRRSAVLKRKGGAE
jgi:excisionase family DNA binding protein